MMTVAIYDRKTREFMGTANLVPECGEDFCEQCGDCLKCFGGDICYYTDGHFVGHHFVIYIDEEWWNAG